MTPTMTRPTQTDVITTTVASPVGRLTLTAVERASHRHGHGRAASCPGRTAGPAAGRRLVRRASPSSSTEYFAGGRTDFDVPLELAGTDFQRRVWSALRDIPYGETISYGELARRVGNPGAVRAVGLANGRNPVAIIVPCHRVIGADGSLTGYGGGLDRKAWLLDHEAANRAPAA